VNYLALQNAVMQDRFDTSAYRERVKGWLNDALGRIVRRSDIPRLRTLTDLTCTAGSDVVDLPENFARGVKLFYPDRGFGDVEEVTDVEIDELFEMVGRPQFYAITGGQLYLWPKPDADYALKFRYQRLAAPMVDDTDVPEIPDDYHDLLVTYATSRGYRSEDDAAQGEKWMTDFEADLTRLKVDLREDSLDGPIVVPGTFGAEVVPRITRLW
jgi:hypothetical protein